MGYFILLICLVVLPVLVGRLFYTKLNRITLGQQWLYGQFFLWALFQVVGVYYILREQKLDQLVETYNLMVQVFALLAIMKVIIRRDFVASKGRDQICGIRSCMKQIWADVSTYKFWLAIFVLLYVVQICAILFLQVNDGDDAFHMAIANVAESSGSMYKANVYAFGNTTLTYRYALAPFPIWIAYLSRISGIHTLTIAHIVLGIMLVTMSYIIYAQCAKELFGENKKKRLQFLCFVAILYVFGNTSSHTAESFLLLRSRQGKALVAGIVFPAIMYLLLHIGKKLEQNKKQGIVQYLLAGSIILTGYLGTPLGGSIVVLLWGSALLFMAIGYKKWNILIGGMLSALPGLMYAVLYLLH